MYHTLLHEDANLDQDQLEVIKRIKEVIAGAPDFAIAATDIRNYIKAVNHRSGSDFIVSAFPLQGKLFIAKSEMGDDFFMVQLKSSDVIDTMYLAVNKATKAKETFEWSSNNRLIIQGKEANPKDWEIVQIAFQILNGCG